MSAAAGTGAAWYRRVSLRSRMIMLTALVVTGVVAAGGVLIGVALKAELIDSTDEAALAWAAEVGQLVAAGDLPPDVPSVVDDEDAAVQVVEDGRVLAATPNLDGARVLDLPQLPADETRVFDFDGAPLEASGPYRVAARGVTTSTGTATVFVAIPVEDVEETIASAAMVGSIGLSLLVLALCAAMWVVIGRTLAPVEAIRAKAEAVSGQHLDQRVPEPVNDDEIGSLARTLNAMLARLQDSADRQRRFVADAAHELRSPLASVRAQLETALARGGPGQRIEVLAPDLMAETLRMQVLVDQLLLLARSDARSLLPARAIVDLDDTVHTVVSSLAHARVPVDLSAVQAVQVTGDWDLLEQVTRNLLDNALRHAEARVRVKLSQDGRWAVLVVDDDGPGIPEQHRVDVFRRFTRLDDARDRDGGGVGLGLAIVADIVAAHDGQVDVACQHTGGARFTVRLPLAR